MENIIKDYTKIEILEVQIENEKKQLIEKHNIEKIDINSVSFRYGADIQDVMVNLRRGRKLMYYIEHFKINFCTIPYDDDLRNSI